MTEQILESKMIDAIKDLELEGLTVDGLWTSADEGFVKGEEAAGDVAEATVAFPVRSYETPSSTATTFASSITLSVRADADPRGVKFLAFADGIAELLNDLHTSKELVDSTFEDDDFDPAFFAFTGGGSPVYSRTDNTWNVTFNFTIRGVISPGTN